MQNFNFYKSFAKKENSTKIPGSGALTLGVQGIFKEPCSVLNPVLKIERLALDAPPYDYTYAKYIEANKYYFVEDWVWADGLWEVHLKEDVLATFKTEIGLQSEYVLRTDSTVNFNGEITDISYPATTDIVAETVENANPFSPDSISSGYYIVGIINGSNANAVGAVTYYAMDSSEFGDLKSILLSDDNMKVMQIIDQSGLDLREISHEVLKTLYNPYQYIASCTWFPLLSSQLVNVQSVTGIHIGWWPYSTLTGKRLTATTAIVSETDISITSHPQSAGRGSYLNYAPYTRRTAHGKFGAVPLDTAFFKAGDSLRITYRIDLITGQCIAIFYRIRSNSIDYITQREFLLGVPIQLAQVGTDYLGAYSTAISTAGNMASSWRHFDPGGVVSAGASGIYNTIQAQMPQLETSGNNGSFLAPSNMTKIITEFYKIVDEDIAHRGRPLCENRQLNTLTGFILCAEGDIDISCYDNERQEITRHLTSGFFWE